MSTTYVRLNAEARTFTAPDTGRAVLTYSANLAAAGRGAYAIVSPEVRTLGEGMVLIAASDNTGLIAHEATVDNASRQLLVADLHPGTEYVARLLGRTVGLATIGDPRVEVTPLADWRDDIARLITDLEDKP
jgi:hypothetical protein